MKLIRMLGVGALAMGASMTSAQTTGSTPPTTRPTQDQDKPVELKVGDKAPAFKMIGSDGKYYTLEQFKGKKGVVIAWFPKAFTGG